MPAKSDWPEWQIQQLRDLWDTGMSTALIAKEMGITKNAIVGKAHRLHLERRPSPIIRNGYVPPSRISLAERRSGFSMLLRLPSLDGIQLPPAQRPSHVSSAPPPRLQGQEATERRSEIERLTENNLSPPQIADAVGVSTKTVQNVVARLSIEESAPPPVVIRPPVVPRVKNVCCWPIGEPRTRQFRLCENADTIPGKPYCWEHAKIAYPKLRQKNEDAA